MRMVETGARQGFETRAQAPRCPPARLLWRALGGLCLALGLFTEFTPSSSAQVTPTVPFAVSHYQIDAQLFPTTHVLKAKVRVDFVPTAGVSSLTLKLDSNLRVSHAADSSGQAVLFKQDGITLNLTLPSLINPGKASSVEIVYSGTLDSADGSPVENLKLNYVASEGSYLLYPGCWFPVSLNDLNRFSATMRIKVPPDETVVASGKPSAPVREADGVTYLFSYEKDSFPGSIVAGKYSVEAGAAGADIAFYLKPGHEQFASGYGQTAARILAFYSEKFGPLPNGHLAVAEIDDGTMSAYSQPGLILLASRAFGDQVNTQLLANEISHQWWRCMVSPATPNDAFLDEGLSTYSAALYLQDAAGDSAFESTMHEIEIGALTHEDTAAVDQAGQLHRYSPEYDSIVFKKGAMVFHMLRWVIGDPAFYKTLQQMASQYAFKTISTDEFQQLAEKASTQQLTYFFAQWVTSTGVPQFKRTWAVYRIKGGYQVVGKVTQDLDIFRMPVEIRVFPEARKPVNQRVDMVGTTSDFTVNTVTKPLRVVVDPGSRILKYDDQIKIDVVMERGRQLEQQQEYLEAIKQYQQALEINKNYSLAHFRLGDIFFKLRNYNAAVEEMRATLGGDLNPKWVEVWAHLTLGKIFDVTGQRDRALNEYQRALQTNDNTQGALDEANKDIQKPFTVPKQTS